MSTISADRWILLRATLIKQMPPTHEETSDREPALIVIDLQRAIDHPAWARHGGRNHPDAEQNIARLLAAWRRCALPIYHVRHDSREPQSAYRPGQDGNEFKPESQPLPGASIVA